MQEAYKNREVSDDDFLYAVNAAQMLKYAIQNKEELINKIDALNNDKSISGIILQLPLPKHINEKKIISSISPKKDIDCLTFVIYWRRNFYAMYS